MDDNFELVSTITQEIYDFIEEIGVEPGRFSYSYSFDAEDNSYAATVKLPYGVDDDVIESFSEYQYEFSGHMAATFPGVEVTLTLEIDDADIVFDPEERDSFLALATDDGCLDDADAEYTDSVERQYADEGLNIIDEDDDAQFCTDEVDSEELLRRATAGVSESTDDGDDPFSDDLVSSPLDEDADDYRPSAEDMEELWRSFGSGDYDE